MPEGTCDPASRGQAYNETSMAQGYNGEVQITFRFGWDGVSVRPDCVGPVTYILGTNNSTTTTYYAHMKGRRNNPITISLAPGETKEETNRQRIRNLGLETNQDVEGLSITTDPNPPPDL